MTMHYQESSPIILGSGELYLGFANEIQDLENLTPEEEEALVNIGAIESGANVSIANQFQDVKSANRGTIMKFKIDSDVKFDTGIMTWNLENISKFLTGSKFNETQTERKMIVGKDDMPPIIYLRFIHTKKDGTGELVVNIYRAMFNDDLSLNFSNENPVTINYNFAGMTNVNNNYIEFIETFAEVVEEDPLP